MAYIQVYTGEGKGKTTAALGLLVRAVGAGLSARLFQFLKSGDYSELATLAARFPEVEVTQLGSGRFIDPAAVPEDERARAQAGFAQLREAALSDRYDLVIADELNVALSMGLVAAAPVLALFQALPARTELVLTGRGAPQAVRDAADLCTEMRAARHYYDRGVPARRGIEF